MWISIQPFLNLYKWINSRICLYFLMLYLFIFYFIKSIVKIVDYYFAYNLYSYYFPIACIFLFILYPLVYYVPTIRRVVIDIFIKCMVHPIFIGYISYTQRVINWLMTHCFIIFFICIQTYLGFQVVYYVDVVWLKYTINMHFIISCYFLLYTLRTVLFLPMFLAGVFANHPRSVELLDDFFLRHPNHLKILRQFGQELLEAFKGPLRVLSFQMERQIVEHPDLTPKVVVAAGVLTAAALGANAHAENQKEKIQQIVQAHTQAAVHFKLEDSKKHSSTLGEASAQFYVEEQNALLKNHTAVGSVYDRVRAFVTGDPSSIEKFQQASENSIYLMAKNKNNTVATSTNIQAGSIHEKSLVETLYTLFL